MSSKKNRPKPAAKTLRDKKKAKDARRAARKAKRSVFDRTKAPDPTWRDYARRSPPMPAGMMLQNLIALGMPGVPRPTRIRPPAILP